MIPKPGYKTTEFLAAVLASVSSWLFEWQGSLNPRYAAIVTGIAAAAYSLSRGLTKMGVALAHRPVAVQPSPSAPTTGVPPAQV